MTQATFIGWLFANQTKMPRGVFAEIKREAAARSVARMQAGHADAPLDFLDLFHRGEAAISA